MDLAGSPVETRWREASDGEGRVYYYDEISGETKWEQPGVFLRADEEYDESEPHAVDSQGAVFEDVTEAGGGEPVVGASYHGDDNGGSEEEATGQILDEGEEAPAAADDEALEEDGGPAWHTAFDEEKQLPYYYNSETNETTWEKPPELVEAEEAESVGGTGPAADDRSGEASGTSGVQVSAEDLAATATNVSEAAAGAAAASISTSSVEASAEAATSAAAAAAADAAPAATDKKSLLAAAEAAAATAALAAARAKLNRPDSIMEKDCWDSITVVLGAGQANPLELVEQLSNNYEGAAAMCGLVAEWIAEFNPSPSSSSSSSVSSSSSSSSSLLSSRSSSISSSSASSSSSSFSSSSSSSSSSSEGNQGADDDADDDAAVERVLVSGLARMVRLGFDSDAVEKSLKKFKKEPKWLRGLCSDPEGQQVLMDLHRRNPQSIFLQTCVSVIQTMGGDVMALTAASSSSSSSSSSLLSAPLTPRRGGGSAGDGGGCGGGGGCDSPSKRAGVAGAAGGNVGSSGGGGGGGGVDRSSTGGGSGASQVCPQMMFSMCETTLTAHLKKFFCPEGTAAAPTATTKDAGGGGGGGSRGFVDGGGGLSALLARERVLGELKSLCSRSESSHLFSQHVLLSLERRVATDSSSSSSSNGNNNKKKRALENAENDGEGAAENSEISQPPPSSSSSSSLFTLKRLRQDLEVSASQEAKRHQLPVNNNNNNSGGSSSSSSSSSSKSTNHNAAAMLSAELGPWRHLREAAVSTTVGIAASTEEVAAVTVVVDVVREALSAMGRVLAEGRATTADAAACHAALCASSSSSLSSSHPSSSSSSTTTTTRSPAAVLTRFQLAALVDAGRHPNVLLGLLTSLFLGNPSPSTVPDSASSALTSSSSSSTGFGFGSSAAKHAAGTLAVLVSFGVGGSGAASKDGDVEEEEAVEIALVERALLDCSTIVGAKTFQDGHSLLVAEAEAAATASSSSSSSTIGGGGDSGSRVKQGGDALELLSRHAAAHPCVAKGLLLWMSARVGVSTSTNSSINGNKAFLDAYHLEPVSAMVKLCKASADAHPPLRPSCLAFLCAVLTTKPPSVGELEKKSASTGMVNVLNDNQRLALNGLVHLATQGGMSLPAVAVMKAKASGGLLDRRTVAEFAQGVARATAPPYSPSFQAAMAELSKVAGLSKTVLAK